MSDYKGSVELISGITPANGGKFPLVSDKDVQMSNGERLSMAIQGLANEQHSTRESVQDLGFQLEQLEQTVNDLTTMKPYEQYFDIDEDGLVSLKPKYRGEGNTNYEYSVSDNGAKVVGSKNAELPSNLVIPNVIDGTAVVSLAIAMFHGNNSVESITIPDYIKEIPVRFAMNSLNLKRVNNTEKIEKVGSVAFQKSGIEVAMFPNAKEFVGNAHFNNCANLTIADIGNTITAVPTACFSQCEKLSTILGGASITTINEQSLQGTKRLRNLSFAEKVIEIKERGLYYSRVAYNFNLNSGCTFGSYSYSSKWNGTNWWTGKTYETCMTPIRSTFSQDDPRWVDDVHAGNCVFCASAAASSAISGFDFASPMDFKAALIAKNPNALTGNSGANTIENAAVWIKSLDPNVETEYVALASDSNALQRVYDALKDGAVVMSGALGWTTIGTNGHEVLLYGVNTKGEVMVLDSSSAAKNLGEYHAHTYAMLPYNLMASSGADFLIIKKK